jgi:hypothetical protein
MSDLSIFKFCVEDDGMSTVIAPLLDLGSLFTLVRVSKRVHKMYHKVIARILKEENAASRLMRACVRELHRRQGLDIEPTYKFQFPRSFFVNYGAFLYFSPTESFRFFVEIRIPFGVGPPMTYNFEVAIRTLTTEPFIYVTCLNYEHLEHAMRVITLKSGDEIPAYQGVGDDPQVRTAWDYEHGVVLYLYERQWVGQNLDIGGTFSYRQFRFHKTPNGVQHALILADDLFHSACEYALRYDEGATAPRLKLDYGVAA